MKNGQFKNSLSFLLLVIFSASCTTTKDNQELKWSSVELPMSSSAKQALLLSMQDSLVTGMVVNSPDTSLLSLFHVLDLNGDGSNDIIYNGFGGASEEFITIFVQDSNRWKKIIYDYGQIQRVQTGPDAEILLLKKEAVGESGGDSLVTFRLSGTSYTRTAQSKN